MHTAVIQSPQAMSNDQSYRPRSPDLPGLADSQHNHPPRLTRLPSYQIEEPSLPQGYSFSPRGSYDASPFFTQPSQQASNPYFAIQPGYSHSEQSSTRGSIAFTQGQPQVFSPVSYNQPPRPQQTSSSFQRSPFQTPRQLPNHQLSTDDMARLRSRKAVNYNEDHNGSQYEDPVVPYPQSHITDQIPQQTQQYHPHGIQPQFQPQPQFTQPMPLAQQPSQAPFQSQPQPQPVALSFPQIDVKTKFPVARIKRIMQADEDVGKVAQATPTAVSKALELFMIALVSKGAAEAKNNNSKRVTATHLKHALLTDPQFDFLNEICESVPDEGAKGSKGRAKSEAKSEDSDEDMGGVAKKKGKGSRKKKTDEEASD